MQTTYNESQQLSILTAAMGILDSETPKVTLIQGPPGTGKSQTIAGLVRLLLHPQVSSLSKSEQANPILVYAPSNIAVDQLAAAARRQCRVDDAGDPKASL